MRTRRRTLKAGRACLKGRKMSKKREYPPQEELDDFTAWYDDLGIRDQEHIETIPDDINLLPDFCRKWTVAELWTAIRDYLGA